MGGPAPEPSPAPSGHRENLVPGPARRAVGEDASGRRYVRTLEKRGRECSASAGGGRYSRSPSGVDRAGPAWSPADPPGGSGWEDQLDGVPADCRPPRGSRLHRRAAQPPSSGRGPRKRPEVRNRVPGTLPRRPGGSRQPGSPLALFRRRDEQRANGRGSNQCSSALDRGETGGLAREPKAGQFGVDAELARSRVFRGLSPKPRCSRGVLAVFSRTVLADCSRGLDLSRVELK
jgi:hypothetical protein